MNTGPEGDAVVSGVLDTGTATPPGDSFSTFEGLNAAGLAALLLAALAERCEQSALIEATAIMVQGPVDVDVLDPLVASGSAVVDRGWVQVPRDEVRPAVTSWALPSRLRQAHLTLGELASAGAVSPGHRAARLVEPGATGSRWAARARRLVPPRSGCAAGRRSGRSYLDPS
jgi:hypothetical protein